MAVSTAPQEILPPAETTESEHQSAAADTPTEEEHPSESTAAIEARHQPSEAETAASTTPFVELELDDQGRVQRCGGAAEFVRLTRLLANPNPGAVAVRGRVWTPLTMACTAGIPEHCVAYPVLARSKPKARVATAIALIGQLSADTPLACTGRQAQLRCPFPIDGREYGVIGELRRGEEGDVPLYTIQVERICRF